MSFEGYYELICPKGHYYTKPLPRLCACGAEPKFLHLVDETNGYYKGDPNTYPARRLEAARYDVPQLDHRGNHYMTLDIRWRPTGLQWQVFSPACDEWVKYKPKVS